MPALVAGARAPEITLPTVDGGKFSLQEALKRGPVVAAFFKVSCPVCQFAFPYVERIFKAYGKSGKFTFVGVSQDSAAETKAFAREYGLTFPILLDPPGLLREVLSEFAQNGVRNAAIDHPTSSGRGHAWQPVAISRIVAAIDAKLPPFAERYRPD